MEIADDGELEDVRRMLSKLGIEPLNACGDVSDPVALRISNARRALEFNSASPADGSAASPFHIVIQDENSPSLGSEFKSGRFDFFVQRPVHPAALRLLILHALYSGPEKRSRPRVAMDASVKLGSGLRPREATLTQLSEKGCGVISDATVFAVGDRTKVTLPRALTDGKALSLEGRIASSVALEEGLDASREISIIFRPPSAAVRAQLRRVMASKGIGAAPIRPKRDRAAASGTGATKKPASGSERRRAPRGNYRRPVLASAKGGVHTIIGRDLSIGGMRVAPDERLTAGDEFKLVIYGSGGCASLMVRAVVVRNDGAKGCALRFLDVDSSTAASLAELVDTLPRIGGAAGGPNVVLSEVIDDA